MLLTLLSNLFQVTNLELYVVKGGHVSFTDLKKAFD